MALYPRLLITGFSSPIYSSVLRPLSTMYASLFAILLTLGPMGFTVLAHPTTRETTTAESGRAIYMLTNSQENAVVALPIADNGLLFGGTRTPTGGEGSALFNPMTNQSVATDALASQSSVTIAGNVRDHRENDLQTVSRKLTYSCLESLRRQSRIQYCYHVCHRLDRSDQAHHGRSTSSCSGRFSQHSGRVNRKEARLRRVFRPQGRGLMRLLLHCRHPFHGYPASD